MLKMIKVGKVKESELLSMLCKFDDKVKWMFVKVYDFVVKEYGEGECVYCVVYLVFKYIYEKVGDYWEFKDYNGLFDS